MEAPRSELLEGTTNAVQIARQLSDLRGVGETSGWMLATALHG